MFGMNHALNKVSHWVSGFLQNHDHSPEAALLASGLRDPRLAPRVPMSNADLDHGTLADLSRMGMKRGKQVTERTHPELMAAWKILANRAGLAKPPQLIIAESNALNAVTINKGEVAITTGLLRVLDLRETVAVLSHELGHVQSDHISKRVTATAVLGAAGAVAGNEIARAGGIGRPLSRLLSKWAPASRLLDKIYGPERLQRPASLLSSLVYIGAGVALGSALANRVSVHPTELDADAKGAALSGDPEGLALALTQLKRHMENHNGFGIKLRQLASGYPSLDKRIDRLGTLEAQNRAQGFLPEQSAVYARLETELLPSVQKPEPHPSPKASVSEIAHAERVGTALAAPGLA